MESKDLDNKGYKLVVEDSEMEVRIDPIEENGYILLLKKDEAHEKILIFPRGTLEGLARTNRDTGKSIIENLLPLQYTGSIGEKEFFKGTDLNYDSIIAIATKVYLQEKENIRKFI